MPISARVVSLWEEGVRRRKRRMRRGVWGEKEHVGETRRRMRGVWGKRRSEHVGETRRRRRRRRRKRRRPAMLPSQGYTQRKRTDRSFCMACVLIIFSSQVSFNSAIRRSASCRISNDVMITTDMNSHSVEAWIHPNKEVSIEGQYI